MLLSPPTLSLVTICRNADETIRDTIASILAQRCEGLEYLVIDGDSIDSTQEIVKAYSGRGVDYFISEPDKGIADAFNKGITAANGDLIGFVNADDQLAEETVQFVISYFTDNPDVDVLHGDLLLYEGDRFIKRMKPSGCWWHPLRLVLYNHPATFVRRHVYEKHGGFNEEFKIAMDVEIFLRWQKADLKIQYVDWPLAIMKVGGVSGTSVTEGFDECRRALILHGYSPTIANIQYYCKLVLNFFVPLGRKFIPGI